MNPKSTNGSRSSLHTGLRVSAIMNTQIGSSWTRGSVHRERSASDARRVGYLVSGSFRLEGPFSASRWAGWRSRSQMASAVVGSAR